ncbi:unnamed protein product [marine sediment metagenome]|uniref:Cyclophilin TM1367-like domain-containing protein n=1 Tax=marine sediment metagenome TaxID=412755 RepID=X0XLW3_9ZZZZ
MTFHQFIVEFSIIGQTNIGRATLVYKLAPQTVALIHYQLQKPIQSRIVVRDGEVAIPFKIGRATPEQTSSKRDVKRGEVAYWPQSQTLIIFLKNKQTYAYPVNIIGEIDVGSMTFFDSLRIGKSIKLEKIKPSIEEEDYLEY